jgi:Spy/CpxP family protein refolding chaperone
MRAKTGIAMGLLAATVVGMAAAASVWAQAEAPGLAGPGERGAFGLLGRLEGFCGVAKIALGLTDAQDQQIKAILRSHREELGAVLERLRTAHDSVSQVVRQDDVDEALIRGRVQQATGALADLAVLHARVHHEVAAVLTAEQRQKAEAFHAVFRSHRDAFRKSFGQRLHQLFEDRS